MGLVYATLTPRRSGPRGTGATALEAENKALEGACLSVVPSFVARRASSTSTRTFNQGIHAVVAPRQFARNVRGASVCISEQNYASESAHLIRSKVVEYESYSSAQGSSFLVSRAPQSFFGRIQHVTPYVYRRGARYRSYRHLCVNCACLRSPLAPSSSPSSSLLLASPSPPLPLGLVPQHSK
jgi:hypothetical protein